MALAEGEVSALALAAAEEVDVEAAAAAVADAEEAAVDVWPLSDQRPPACSHANPSAAEQDSP